LRPPCRIKNFIMASLYDIATATVAATMVGNEFAVAVFVHPQLRKLNDNAHAQIAQPLASILGKTMPLWYGLALALILGAAYEHRPISNGPGALIALAAILLAITIVFTVTTLVPINNRIAKMNPQQPYPTWLQDRCRWDKLHRIRVELLIVAVLVLLAGLFGGITTHTS
jgi:Ca2+/H+ antiporter